MIEKNDPPTKRHEFGKDGRVISDKYRRSIEKLRRLVDEFDALVEPEVSDLGRSGVGVSEDGPTISPPSGDALPENRPVDLETGFKFRHRYPDGSWRLPVERDGDSSWLVFTPEAGMPRVKLWTTDDNGRPVITPGPPSRHFIVRTEERDYIAMLFRESEWAVMWPGSDRETHVGLPGPVFDINDLVAGVPDGVVVTGDEDMVPYWDGADGWSYIVGDAFDPTGESFPDW